MSIWVWTRLHSWGKILVDFYLGRTPSLASPVCSTAWRTYQDSPVPWQRFPPLTAGAQTLAKVKRKEWWWWSRPTPRRNFVHVIRTHANTAPATRIWKSGLRRAPDRSPQHGCCRSGRRRVSRTVWEAGTVPADALPGFKQGCKPLLFTSITLTQKISP